MGFVIILGILYEVISFVVFIIFMGAIITFGPSHIKNIDIILFTLPGMILAFILGIIKFVESLEE